MTQQVHRVRSTPLPEPARVAQFRADEALTRLDDALSYLEDGDLHLAHRDGGWTVAQVISHVNLGAILWLGNLWRLVSDPGLQFLYREEIGHDATGYPPPTTARARGLLGDTRRALAAAGSAIEPEVLDRQVEITDLGIMSVGEWFPEINGHVADHVDQAFEILRDRGVLPEGF